MPNQAEVNALFQVVDEKLKCTNLVCTQNSRPVMVRYQGNLIVLGSDVCVWRNKGNAERDIQRYLHLNMDKEVHQLAWQKMSNKLKFVIFEEVTG